MNSELPFPYHNYQNHLAQGAYRIVASSQARPIEDPQPSDVSGVGTRLRKAGVSEIILVHGTFAGNDVLGLVREVARLSPQMASALKSLSKQLFDEVAGEIGNYPESFASRLEHLINDEHQVPIPVSRFNWSGENHHLGRAGGAIALLAKIISGSFNSNDRLLIWGHSHGGNLLAMLSHLIGCSDAGRDKFFAATRSHYRNPIGGRLDLPLWEDVRRQLDDERLAKDIPKIDAINFGTPLRYRWNRSVVPKLLHFVQHRVLRPDQPSVAAIPSSIQEVFEAIGGDYVQQFGIGGTDFLHSIVAWRSWNSERRLHKMFEKNIRRRDLAKNLLQGSTSISGRQDAAG